MLGQGYVTGLIIHELGSASRDPQKLRDVLAGTEFRTRSSVVRFGDNGATSTTGI
jgi:hypothetical protein